jgi:hypothetical protein
MHINNIPPSLGGNNCKGSSGVLRSVTEDFAALSETFEKLVCNLKSKGRKTLSRLNERMRNNKKPLVLLRRGGGKAKETR